MSSRAPRLVALGPVPPPVTGAAVVTRRSIDAAIALGARVDVVDTNDNAPTHVRLRRMLAGFLLLVRRLRQRPTIYVGGAGGELLWYQLVVVAVARLGGMRTVFHHHNSAYLARTAVVMRLLVAAGGPALVHVVLGERMRDQLQRRYPRARQVLVCSNAAQMAAGAGPAARGPLEQSSAGEGSALVVGHLSNLTLEKGLDRVLDAVVAAVRSGVDVSLRLGGPAASSDAERLVAEAQRVLGDRLTWVGPVPHDEVDSFHAGLDLFLFPSRYAQESEPLVVLEAARNGVPTLAHDVGCVAELVTAPGGVVPVDDDYVTRAVALMAALAVAGGPSTEERAAVRARFDSRRDAALLAQDDLHGLLTGRA